MLPHMEGSLQGRLLIATPTLGDPNFAGAVVLIAEHDAQGAMGLVLNRPLDVTVADAVPILSGFVAHNEPVHQGGPVQPEAVLALGDFVDGNRSAAIAFGSVGFLPADADETLDPATVIRARVFAGYAGWGAGQLEGELDEEAWVVVPAQIDDCFTERPEELWRQALRRHGGQLAVFALQPDDPSLN
jgi:putative transcriptional regulator